MKLINLKFIVQDMHQVRLPGTQKFADQVVFIGKTTLKEAGYGE